MWVLCRLRRRRHRSEGGGVWVLRRPIIASIPPTIGGVNEVERNSVWNSHHPVDNAVGRDKNYQEQQRVCRCPLPSIPPGVEKNPGNDNDLLVVVVIPLLLPLFSRLPGPSSSILLSSPAGTFGRDVAPFAVVVWVVIVIGR